MLRPKNRKDIYINGLSRTDPTKREHNHNDPPKGRQESTLIFQCNIR